MRSVVLRLGDNMREVAVTEGDKVEAQINYPYGERYTTAYESFLDKRFPAFKLKENDSRTAMFTGLQRVLDGETSPKARALGYGLNLWSKKWQKWS
jgi:hypothetical protein